MYYKVVVDNGNGSYSSSYTTGRWQLSYAIGESTIPRVGGVFLFSSCIDAEDYLAWLDKHGDSQQYAILEVEAWEVWIPEKISFYSDEEFLDEFYGLGDGARTEEEMRDLPWESLVEAGKVIPRRVLRG